jgi:hypothetical protein
MLEGAVERPHDDAAPRGPHRHQPTLVDDAHPVRHLLGHLDLVGAQEDGHPLPGPFPEKILHDAGAAGVEPDHGLIDHEHLGAMQQRTGRRSPPAGGCLGG